MKKLNSDKLQQPAKIAKREVAPRNKKAVAFTRAFSVYPEDMQYLSDIVVRVMGESHTSCSFSEALRVVIKEHREAGL